MGPIAVPPAPKAKKRWRKLTAWTLFVFAGGVAAGPPLVEQTYSLIEHLSGRFGMRLPRIFHWGDSTPASAALPTAKPTSVPTVSQLEVSAGAETGAGQAAAPTLLVPKPTSPTLTQTHVGAAARGAPTRTLAENSSAGNTGARRGHGKSTGKKGKQSNEPFDSESSSRSTSPATTSHKPEPAPAKPAPKSASKAGGKSRDSLDDLMDGVAATDPKAKGKKHDSREIDSMLKEVQKSNPEPAPKRETAPTAAPLTSADISKAMAVVKARGNDCAHRLGQSGTAELKITVSTDGKVSDVRIGGKIAGSPLADCVERAARAAPFRPNSGGLRFDYRIDVR
jgi:hypothetical protein